LRHLLTSTVKYGPRPGRLVLALSTVATRSLVLASASPARLRLLRDAGIDPEVIVSGFDESSIARQDPLALVAALAQAKAEAVAARVWSGTSPAGPIVLGCDSMLVFDGEVLGKPGTAEAATARWHQMRGKTGVLLTGHSVVDTSTRRHAAEVGETIVHFGEPSDAEVERYVATGEPLDVAGAFTLDGRAAPFIDGIEGDASNVIGLSLPVLRRLLERLGIGITELWR
jgi:septum formation protein